jgi:hypothetical protein
VGGAPVVSDKKCNVVQKGCVRALLKVINADRQMHGVTPLALSWQQSRCSRKHSIHMMVEGHISHDEFPQDVCIPRQGAGENVGICGPDRVIASDLNCINNEMLSEPWSLGCSGNHVCNLRSPDYTTIGIGIEPDDGAVWLTEDFVR